MTYDELWYDLLCLNVFMKVFPPGTRVLLQKLFSTLGIILQKCWGTNKINIKKWWKGAKWISCIALAVFDSVKSGVWYDGTHYIVLWMMCTCSCNYGFNVTVWARQTNSVLISKTAALSVDTVLCCCTQGENVYDSMHKTWMRLRRLAETEAI